MFFFTFSQTRLFFLSCPRYLIIINNYNNLIRLEQLKLQKLTSIGIYIVKTGLAGKPAKGLLKAAQEDLIQF